jgi:hypothetical protein
MGKQGKAARATRRRGWSGRAWLAAGVLLVAAASGAGLWLRAATEEAQGGTPRLVVDRTDVNLGYRRFEAPARVVFTLTNAGDGPLRLAESPPVVLVAGC